MYTYGCFMLMYGRNQHNIVKRLSSNKREGERKDCIINNLIESLKNEILDNNLRDEQEERKENIKYNRLVQFSSVAQSCPTLCDPMNLSMPGLPVHHQHPEFTQTQVY